MRAFPPLLFGVLCSLTTATTTKDRVLHLPGLGAPATAHYSGFVEVDKTSGSHLFYYYVEAEQNPETAPVVWWMNGGPGASSLIGLFAETGPYILTSGNKLMPNPYAWNKRANLLFVEFGEGIGYSFCANSSRADAVCKQSSPDCSPCPTSDSRIATQNAAFLEKFLGGPGSLFPELSNRPLYLAGEVRTATVSRTRSLLCP